MSQKIRFGTDGWRGIVGKDFNLENVAYVAQAVADYLLNKDRGKIKAKEIALGYDTRRMSRQAAYLISRVLTANNIGVILSDQPLPTQAISYVVKRYRLTLGIMVTASHNPPNFNGIKIKGSFGGSVENKITDVIEKLIYKNEPFKLSILQAKKRKLLREKNLVDDYLQFVRSYLDMPLLRKSSFRLKILVDSMHGTANSYIARLLKGTCCRVTTIHKNFDSSFGGIKPEPIQSCLREAARLMKSRKFDLGLANDGDSDRIAAFDARGRFVNPQEVVSLLLLHLIRYRRLRGAVVKTISGTALLEKIAGKYKLKVYETPVGFKHISYFMQKRNFLIGGEEGGGIGFKNYLPERDGILAALLLIEMMIASKSSLLDLWNDMQQEFGSFYYLRKDLNCPVYNKNRVKAKLKAIQGMKTFSGLKIKKVKDYDGLKFYLDDGSWILFRLSGTEPILRIYAEADRLTKTRKLINEGERILKL